MPRRRPFRTPDEAYRRHVRRYGRKLGIAIERAMRVALEAVRQDRKITGDAAGDDDWPRNIGDDARKISQSEAADIEYWARRQAEAAAKKVPTPKPKVIAATAADMAEKTVDSARAELLALGAKRATLAARLNIPAGELLAFGLTQAESLDLAGWVAEGMKRIVTLAETETERHIAWMAREMERGSTYRKISKGLQARADMTASHADLIARDQVGKLSHRFTKSTHKAAGVSQYFWDDVDDSATRKKHVEAGERSDNGHAYTYDQPEIEGVVDGELVEPGEDIQCRCSARPKLPDDLK